MTPLSWQDFLVKGPLLILGESNEERCLVVQKPGGSGVSPGIWSFSLLGWYGFGSTCLTGCVPRNRAPFLFVPFVKSLDPSASVTRTVFTVVHFFPL